MANVWALELPGAAVGLLVRSNEAAQPVTLIRLDPELAMLGAPTTVGRLPHGTEGVGGQPRGAVAGDRIIFSERETDQQFCSLLRSALLDGEGARDLPWHLPCWRQRVNQDFIDMPLRLHPFLELHAVQNAVTVVYVDAPNSSVAAADPEVHVAAVVLTPDGRRGTELIDLESPEASALAFVRTANDGDELVAAYFDQTSGREGYWLRRFAYVPDPR